jgi:hypothetical protein
VGAPLNLVAYTQVDYYFFIKTSGKGFHFVNRFFQSSKLRKYYFVMKVAKIESFGSRLGIWLSPPISINPSKLPKFEQVLARQNNKKNNT